MLFDILFNLHKFMRFETRDPFQEKLRREDVHRSDWDRYAHIEYNRLAQEEEGYDNSMEMDLQQYIETEQKQGGGQGGSLREAKRELGEQGGGGTWRCHEMAVVAGEAVLHQPLASSGNSVLYVGSV